MKSKVELRVQNCDSDLPETGIFCRRHPSVVMFFNQLYVDVLQSRRCQSDVEADHRRDGSGKQTIVPVQPQTIHSFGNIFFYFFFSDNDRFRTQKRRNPDLAVFVLRALLLGRERSMI